MIHVFFTARQLIALYALPKGQKYNQEYFVQNTLPPLLNQKKRLSRHEIVINSSVHMDNLMCHNRHRVADELRRLEILRVPHPLYLPDISPCDFWIFGDCKGKLRDDHLQGPEEILTVVQKLWDNIILEELQTAFQSWRDRLRWMIEHDGEYFRKRHICKLAISWTSKNRCKFSLLFDHPVYPSGRRVGSEVMHSLPIDSFAPFVSIFFFCRSISQYMHWLLFSAISQTESGLLDAVYQG
jgi:hypothetical protein